MMKLRIHHLSHHINSPIVSLSFQIISNELVGNAFISFCNLKRFCSLNSCLFNRFKSRKQRVWNSNQVLLVLQETVNDSKPIALHFVVAEENALDYGDWQASSWLWKQLFRWSVQSDQQPHGVHSKIVQRFLALLQTSRLDAVLHF